MHVTDCKHLCGGIRGELEHLPCLKEDCTKIGVVGDDDWCNVCWLSELSSEPCVLLSCNHVFHYNCIKNQIDQGYKSMSAFL